MDNIKCYPKLTSTQGKERFYQSELVNACVPYSKAVKAASILASRRSDDELASEDVQLVKQVCRQWLEQRQRHHLLRLAVNETANSLSQAK